MIREWLFSHSPDPHAHAATELADRISDHADEIKDKARKYIRSRDPFAALAADLYNRDQVSRLWKGPAIEP